MKKFFAKIQSNLKSIMVGIKSKINIKQCFKHLLKML